MRFRKRQPEIGEPAIPPAGPTFTDPFEGIAIDRKSLYKPFGYSELAQGMNPGKILTVAEAMRPSVARLAIISILIPPIDVAPQELPSHDDETRMFIDWVIPEGVLTACEQTIEENSDIFRTNYYSKKRAEGDRERAVKEGLRMVDQEIIRLYATVVPVQQGRILAEFEQWLQFRVAS